MPRFRICLEVNAYVPIGQEEITIAVTGTNITMVGAEEPVVEKPAEEKPAEGPPAEQPSPPPEAAPEAPTAEPAAEPTEGEGIEGLPPEVG